MSNKKKELSFLIYLIPLLLIEILFRVQNSQTYPSIVFVRSLLFVGFLTSILYLINTYLNTILARILTVLLFLFNSIYAFFQTGIHYYYGHFFSMRFLFEGTPDVGSYTVDFLKYLKFETYAFILIGLISIAIYLYIKPEKATDTNSKYLLISIMSSLLLYLAYIAVLFIGDAPNAFESSIKLYIKPYYTENAMNQLGMSSFISTDIIYSLTSDGSLEVKIPQEEIVDEPIEESEEEKPSTLDGRIQDDLEWIQARDAEQNDTIRSIDNYFLGKSYTERNDKTGVYKDKNFIYVLVEAFDMIAIHETLTPTLYKMQQEGTYFDHFFSPQFNCATAESELMSLSSLYPVIDTCTMSAYYDRTSPQTIFNLFKNQSYNTSSYHNWNDQFYPRSIIHPELGSDHYRDVKTLIPRLISGWQSDLTMMEGIVKELNAEEGKFMSYIITSSTHLPYDAPSSLGNRYVNRVLEVYPDAPLEIRTYLSKAVELDLAMQYLLENLSSMDNTVVAMYADHRPLKMKGAYLDRYSDINRLAMYELDRTPMIVYNPQQVPEKVSKVSSTIDMAPTFANLFDLDYDTRLFMGNDIFSNEENFVIFQNGSWYSQKGYFSTADARFYPFDEANSISSDEINRVNQIVKNKMSVSSLIYTHQYFNKRLFIQDKYKQLAP